MTFDAEFWVAVCFFVFLGFAYKPCKKYILHVLDNKILLIKQELDYVNKAKNDADKELRSYKKKLVVIEQDIQVILDNTEVEINNMVQNAEQEVANFLNKRSEQIMNKIASYELEAIKNVQNKAMQEAIEVIISIIGENLDIKKISDLSQSALTDIGKKLH